MLPVPVISRSPGTVRLNGQNAVIAVLIVQFPATSVPPTAAQVRRRRLARQPHRQDEGRDHDHCQ